MFRGKISNPSVILSNNKARMQQTPLYESAHLVPHALQELQEAVHYHHLLFQLSRRDIDSLDSHPCDRECSSLSRGGPGGNRIGARLENQRNLARAIG